MNRLSALLASAGLLLLGGCGLGSAEAGAQEKDQVYRLHYVVTIDREAGGAQVELTLRQRDGYLRELDMPLLDGRIGAVEGDGEVAIADGRAAWQPPADGGRLRWFARLEHQRGDGGYDAYLAADWALFRGEDVIPSARTRTVRGAFSRTSLELRLPPGWSSVTPWPGDGGRFEIDNPKRRFDTPTGWIVLGRLGVRNDTIAGIRTRIAGPVDHGVRRLDMLALLNWTLPEVLRVLPDFPERLTVVSAGDPMWRGALSGPASLYIHAERPLISENGTSPLLHEVMHVGLGVGSEDGADWIVEGLAEYYGLEALRRSGTISEQRYARALEGLAEWGREVDTLCARVSSGSRTARAVTVFARLNAEIRQRTDGRHSLDDVLERIAERGRNVSVDALRDIATDVAGEPLDALGPRHLPGCDDG
ncbi:MAG TPA: hypothetical protein VKZ85_11575 [Woeseiaceae bacterium]|nr:hypothetical protein [Woeseiaceae bacterium]